MGKVEKEHFTLCVLCPEAGAGTEDELLFVLV